MRGAFVVALIAAGSLGCLERQKQDSPLLAEMRQATSPIERTPVVRPVRPRAVLEDLPLKPAADQEPRPALPGLPGTPSAVQPDRKDLQIACVLPADDTPDEPRTGPVRRLIQKLQEQREKAKKPPELPSAFEPKAKMPDEKKPIEPTQPPQAIADAPAVIKPASHTTPTTVNATSTADVAAARKLVAAAAKTFDATADFTAKLTKRETVGGKKIPTEEMIFRYRAEPFSVRLTVTGEAGKGRDVLYVKGQNNDKLTVVTGNGDNRLVGAGFKLTLDKTDPRATARTRGRIDESGLGRPIRVLGKLLDDVDAGTRDAGTVKHLGLVERKEFKQKLAAVEVTLTKADDAILTQGGKRTYYFDTDDRSPSATLPVLVATLDATGSEIEYYCFSDFVLPARLTDKDFDPVNLGKKK